MKRRVYLAVHYGHYVIMVGYMIAIGLLAFSQQYRFIAALYLVTVCCLAVAFKGCVLTHMENVYRSEHNLPPLRSFVAESFRMLHLPFPDALTPIIIVFFFLSGLVVLLY